MSRNEEDSEGERGSGCDEACQEELPGVVKRSKIITESNSFVAVEESQTVFTVLDRPITFVIVHKPDTGPCASMKNTFFRTGRDGLRGIVAAIDARERGKEPLSKFIHFMQSFPSSPQQKLNI